MASTRALSKRPTAWAPGPTRKATWNKKKKIDAASRRAKAAQKASDQAKKRPMGLLELPAEIRNIIFDFATETKFEGGWTDAVPMVVHNPGCDRSGWCRRTCCRPKQWPMDPELPTARQFFGLTQVCKQLREEYRPIWLRNSRVRVAYEDVADYIYTFHGLETQWTHLPEMLQISVDYPFDDPDDIMDLTLPLRIHAHSKGSKVEVVPYELTLGEEGAYNYDHLAQTYEEYVAESLGDRFPYVVGVNNLLAHDNPFWLHDIEKNNVIGFELQLRGRRVPDARILLNPQVKLISTTQDKATLQAAVQKYFSDRRLATMVFEMVFQLE